MGRTIPLFAVPSIEETVAYYRDVLGWKISFTMPDASGRLVYGSVEKDDWVLMFSPAAHLPEAARAQLGAGTVIYFMTEGDLDAYYEQVRARGARITEEIGDRFWGDRTFDVTDLNGYLLTFAKTVREPDFSEVLGAPSGT